MLRKLPVLLAVAAALAFGVAACGEDDEDADTGAATTEATTTETATAEEAGGGGGETVRVVETDFAIDPSDPTVAAGTVTFEITNEGQSPHNLEVEGNGIEEVSDTFNAGESGELTVDLKPGKYDFYCAIDGHKDLGMDGTLTVQ